jgi:hypothetical protein
VRQSQYVYRKKAILINEVPSVTIDLFNYKEKLMSWFKYPIIDL